MHRKPLNKGKRITVSAYSVRIGSCISRGGSCLVYEGKIVKVNGQTDGGLVVGNDVIVKEFYPAGYYITRSNKSNDKHSLIIPHAREKDFQKRLGDFKKGQEEFVAYGLKKNVTAMNIPFADGCDNNTYYTIAYPDEGASLKQLGDKRADWTIHDVANIMKYVCIAIYNLHKTGRLYLDLKPENIWYCNKTGGLEEMTEPLVGLFDFDTVTKVSVIEKIRNGEPVENYIPKSSPDYAAPEQNTGKYDQIGYHTDAFAIGTVFYWLLTGNKANETTAKNFAWMEETGCLIERQHASSATKEKIENLLKELLEWNSAKRKGYYPLNDSVVTIFCRFRELASITEGGDYEHASIHDVLIEITDDISEISEETKKKTEEILEELRRLEEVFIDQEEKTREHTTKEGEKSREHTTKEEEKSRQHTTKEVDKVNARLDRKDKSDKKRWIIGLVAVIALFTALAIHFVVEVRFAEKAENSLVENNRIDQMHREIIETQEIMSESASVNYRVGIENYENGEYGKAISYLKAALKQQDDVTGSESLEVAAIYLDIGLSYERAGKDDTAIDCYNNAIAILKIINEHAEYQSAYILACYYRARNYAYQYFADPDKSQFWELAQKDVETIRDAFLDMDEEARTESDCYLMSCSYELIASLNIHDMHKDNEPLDCIGLINCAIYFLNEYEKLAGFDCSESNTVRIECITNSHLFQMAYLFGLSYWDTYRQDVEDSDISGLPIASDPTNEADSNESDGRYLKAVVTEYDLIMDLNVCKNDVDMARLLNTRAALYCVYSDHNYAHLPTEPPRDESNLSDRSGCEKRILEDYSYVMETCQNTDEPECIDYLKQINGNLGGFYIIVEEYDKAIPYLELSLEYAVRGNAEFSDTESIMSNLALSCKHCKQYDTALSLYYECYNECKKNHMRENAKEYLDYCRDIYCGKMGNSTFEFKKWLKQQKAA